MGGTRLTTIAAAMTAGAVAAFRTYPLYMQVRSTRRRVAGRPSRLMPSHPAPRMPPQCDPRWGTNPMGTPGPGERSTICGEGCAMSSVSMALAGLGVTIGGAGADPATLNAWLEANKGYVCIDGDCNNLVLSAPTGLDARFTLVGEQPAPPMADIQAGLTRGDTVYIAHVRNRTHFVLLTGFDASSPDSFTVNDPFYSVSSYPYGNISDIIVYHIAQAGATRNTPKLRAPALAAAVAVNRFGVNGAGGCEWHGGGAAVGAAPCRVVSPRLRPSLTLLLPPVRSLPRSGDDRWRRRRCDRCRPHGDLCGGAVRLSAVQAGEWVGCGRRRLASDGAGL